MLNEDEILDIANDMAFMACIWIKDDSNEFKDMIAFGKLVAKALSDKAVKQEREACAVIAEEWFCGCGRGRCPEGDLRAQDIANSIRARGQE